MSEVEKSDATENTELPEATGIDAEIEQELNKPEDTAPQEEESQEDSEVIQDELEEEKESGWQKRINKRTADFYREKKERERLEKLVAELQSKPAQQQTAKPTLEEYDYDDDKYQEALIEWKIEHKLGETLSNQKKQEERERLRKQADDFARKVAKANIPNYEEVVYNLVESVKLPIDILTAINHDEKGPEIMFYLGKNLDIADDLSSMSPIMVGRKLAEISQKITAPKQKKTTKAPDPVKPVGSGGGTRSKAIEDLSMSEIMEDPTL